MAHLAPCLKLTGRPWA